MARAVVVLILAGWFVLRIVVGLPDDYLHIIFCDVGQGDAILIRHKSFQMLIDGGGDTSVLQCLQRYMPLWDHQLELMVATHPHSDHINGLVAVLGNFQVKTLIHSGQGNQSADFDRFKRAVDKEHLQAKNIMVAREGMQFKVGNYIDLSILHPINSTTASDPLTLSNSETLLSDVSDALNQKEINLNNSSVVLKLTYLYLDILLMGDLEMEEEAALLARGMITGAEVLKVGHHGAKTSSTDDFITQVKPEISVISVGKNNSYGHPNPLVLDRLDKIGSLILRTDLDSTIELVSDGKLLWRRRSNFLLK